MADELPSTGKPEDRWLAFWAGHGRLIRGLVIASAVGIGLFYLAELIFPQLVARSARNEIEQFLYEDANVPKYWAEFIGIVWSFIYSAAWAPLMLWTLRASFWKFNLRNVALGLIGAVVIYGHMPLAHALLGAEACVNQRTGQPIKWYFVDFHGEIVLRDSPGFESTTGAARRPATAQICRIKQLQAAGIKPHAITADPREVKFFDDITGQPRVWYHQVAGGRIDLFDAEGVDPAVGEPLQPVTRAIAKEARDQATAAQAAAQRAEQFKAKRERERAAEAERIARLDAEQAAAEAKEDARRALIELFGVSNYAPGTVIVGVARRSDDEASSEAAQQLLKAIIGGLRRSGLVAEEFVSKVYSSGQFDMMIGGNTAILADVGLAQKMRAALLGRTAAACRQATAVAGVITCSVKVEMRVVRPTGAVMSHRWSEVGAGASTMEAVARAMELLVSRNPGWLDGI